MSEQKLENMHLIWFNSVTGDYEYGDVSSYQRKKMNNGNMEDFTVLMEFPGDDKDLASKVIEELNQANDEHALAS